MLCIVTHFLSNAIELSVLEWFFFLKWNSHVNLVLWFYLFKSNFHMHLVYNCLRVCKKKFHSLSYLISFGNIILFSASFHLSLPTSSSLPLFCLSHLSISLPSYISHPLSLQFSPSLILPLSLPPSIPLPLSNLFMVQGLGPRVYILLFRVQSLLFRDYILKFTIDDETLGIYLCLPPLSLSIPSLSPLQVSFSIPSSIQVPPSLFTPYLSPSPLLTPSLQVATSYSHPLSRYLPPLLLILSPSFPPSISSSPPL